MENKSKQEQSQELVNVIISKCWEDTAFKQQLLENPEVAIKSLTGKDVNLPEGKKLIINDQTNEEFVHLNIPPRPDFNNLELTDEELELVAGGATPLIIVAGYLIGRYLL